MQLNQVECSSMLKQKWLPMFSNRPGNNRIRGYLMLFKVFTLSLSSGSKFKHGYTEKFLLSTWLSLGSPGERKPRQRNCLDPVGLRICLQCFFYLLTAVGGPTSLWMVSFLGRGSELCKRAGWASQVGESQEASPLCCPFISSCLQVPVLTSLDVKLLTCMVRWLLPELLWLWCALQQEQSKYKARTEGLVKHRPWNSHPRQQVLLTMTITLDQNELSKRTSTSDKWFCRPVKTHSACPKPVISSTVLKAHVKHLGLPPKTFD